VVAVGYQLDKADVLAELHAIEVLEHFGAKFRKRGREYRLSTCPRCGETSSSAAVAVNVRDGKWCHHGHDKDCGGECFGDIFDLAAAFAGLNVKRDFAKVVEIAAKIAGVEARHYSDSERVDRRVKRELARLEIEKRHAEEDAREHAEGLKRASRHWTGLAAPRDWRKGNARPWTAEGDAHLRSRGFAPRHIQTLVDGDFVRCDKAGTLHVAVHDYDDSELINVQRRFRFPLEGEPKTKCLPDCSTSGSLVSRILDIDKRDTIVTEGVVDTLTAVVLWPDALALGAYSAGQLVSLFEAAAPRVKERGGRLLLVPDSDEVGKRAAIGALQVAKSAGLVFGETMIVVEIGDHHDLNAAFMKGWKP